MRSAWFDNGSLSWTERGHHHRADPARERPGLDHGARAIRDRLAVWSLCERTAFSLPGPTRLWHDDPSLENRRESGGAMALSEGQRMGARLRTLTWFVARVTIPVNRWPADLRHKAIDRGGLAR